MSKDIFELYVGRAGEYLVCSDLLSKGYNAFLSDQGLPYDVVMEHEGILFKIQVKTATKPRDVSCKSKTTRVCYNWNPRVKGKAGKGELLSDKDCDIVALVGLDKKRIAYFHTKDIKTTMQLNCPDNSFTFKGNLKKGPYIDQFPIEKLFK